DDVNMLLASAGGEPRAVIELFPQAVGRALHQFAAALADDAAEIVNREQDGDDLVIDRAVPGERAVYRCAKRAEHADEKQLFDNNTTGPQLVPRAPAKRTANQNEDNHRG